MIRIAEPIIGRGEIEAVNEVLRSGMLAQGPKVAQLEKDFAAQCGTKYAVVVNSGTAAIHAALFAAGVGPGDEVITTPFSFIGTVNPIIELGARPVFVDINSQTFNIDVDKIEKAIAKKTKVIMPVHLYGQPADMKKIIALAKKYKLIVIEDACQAIGAEYFDIKVGNLGDMACFSLYATKNIMSGEGGVVTTNKQKYAEAIRRFRQHGMNSQYEYAHSGYNYRMSDLHAAIAVEQLKKADKFNASRQENAVKLSKALQSIQGVFLPKTAKNRSHVYHQYTIRVTSKFPLSRQQLVNKLKAQDIVAGIYYHKPLHIFPHVAKHGYKSGQFPEAELAAREVLSLPIHPKVRQQDLKKIAIAIKDAARGKK